MDEVQSSDGEISGNDLSDISEDEYFDKLANIIERRKLELELMNEIEQKSYDDYPKENRYLNNRNRQNTSTSSSSRRNNNNNNVGLEKFRNKDIRNRSYRASSVFSTSYVLPKRKKNERPNRRKRRRSKQNIQSQLHHQLKKEPQNFVNHSTDDEESAQFVESKKHIENENEFEDEDEDEELLSLRLEALTSKQEVKELIEPEVIVAVPSPPEKTNSIVPNEEELLRIAALHSAVLKKKDHIKERKKLRMLENERPYSPTDIFEPIMFDEAMELSNSPLGSPFNTNAAAIQDDDDINQEVDMDISTPATPVHETSDMDMDLALSPQKLDEEQIEYESKEIIQTEDENEEELRTMLLPNMNEKKKEITFNLKMAVERLKQQKQPSQAPIVVAQKSGNKTIKMILEEKNKKVNQKFANSTDKFNLSSSEASEQKEENKILQQTEEEEKILGNIINSEEQQVFSKPPSPVREATEEASFSTITDTKNIPLLPQTQEVVKSKDKRLITSLDSVIKPVSPLIISLHTESSDDEHAKISKKNSKTHLQKGKNEFEQNLDNFLKNIRNTQEQKIQSVKPSNSLTSLKNNKAHTSSQSVTKSQSAVKHLPLSSQMEYENLLEKMRMLQEKKKQRQELRELKRTKSSSSTISSSPSSASKEIKATTPVKSTATITSEINKITPKKNVDVQKSVNKIDDTLNKIPLLDEAARERLIYKTEINFHNHSKNLMDSTENNLKMLDESTLQVKQRNIVEAKIQELEKTLTKYKSFLKVVNSKIKTSIPKIISSQRDMIKLRNRQHQFKDICKRVGESVRGTEYGLPDDKSPEIIQNFIKISEKTEQLQYAFKEQYASKQLKMLADKVKSFVPENKILTEEKKKNDDITDDNLAAKETIENNDNQAKGCSSEEASSVHEIEEKFKVDSNKRLCESSSFDNAKRIKIYDSPLEYLKHSDKSRDVNEVVCPFALEGSCNDEKCKMLHL